MHMPNVFRQINVSFVDPPSEQEIRTAFVNRTKSTAKRRFAAARQLRGSQAVGLRDSARHAKRNTVERAIGKLKV